MKIKELLSEAPILANQTVPAAVDVDSNLLKPVGSMGEFKILEQIDGNIVTFYLESVDDVIVAKYVFSLKGRAIKEESIAVIPQHQRKGLTFDFYNALLYKYDAIYSDVVHFSKMSYVWEKFDSDPRLIVDIYLNGTRINRSSDASLDSYYLEKYKFVLRRIITCQ